MAYKDFIGDANNTPQIALAVPWPDSNCQTPSTDGAPYPWQIGSKLQGFVYGAQRYHSRMSIDSACMIANPYGTGRSLYIDLASSTANGDANSIIRTPPSLGGWVPKYGVSVTQEMSLVVCYAASSLLSGDVEFILEQYSSTGTLLASTTMGTIDCFSNSTGTPGGEDYVTVVMTSDTSLLQATTDYFRLAMVFDRGAPSGSKFSIDCWQLAFIPGLGPETSGLQSFRDDYVARNFMAPKTTKVSHFRSDDDLVAIRTNQSRNISRVEAISFEFYRTSQAWRDDIMFFWEANQAGFPSADDAVPTGLHNQLGNKLWPLVLRPRIPGVKQVMTVDMVNYPFPVDVDHSLNYVEASPKSSGVLTFEEVIF